MIIIALIRVLVPLARVTLTTKQVLRLNFFFIRRLTLSLHSSSQLPQQLLCNNVFLQLILCPLHFTFFLSKPTRSHLAIYLFVGR